MTGTSRMNPDVARVDGNLAVSRGFGGSAKTRAAILHQRLAWLD